MEVASQEPLRNHLPPEHEHGGMVCPGDGEPIERLDDEPSEQRLLGVLHPGPGVRSHQPIHHRHSLVIESHGPTQLLQPQGQCPQLPQPLLHPDMSQIHGQHDDEFPGAFAVSGGEHAVAARAGVAVIHRQPAPSPSLTPTLRPSPTPTEPLSNKAHELKHQQFLGIGYIGAVVGSRYPISAAEAPALEPTHGLPEGLGAKGELAFIPVSLHLRGWQYGMELYPLPGQALPHLRRRPHSTIIRGHGWFRYSSNCTYVAGRCYGITYTKLPHPRRHAFASTIHMAFQAIKLLQFTYYFHYTRLSHCVSFISQLICVTNFPQRAHRRQGRRRRRSVGG